MVEERDAANLDSGHEKQQHSRWYDYRRTKAARVKVTMNDAENQGLPPIRRQKDDSWSIFLTPIIFGRSIPYREATLRMLEPDSDTKWTEFALHRGLT